ncbi:hypothetical protein ABEX38_29830 [Priestia megaterium]
MEKSINAEMVINEWKLKTMELMDENMMLKAYIKQLESENQGK